MILDLKPQYLVDATGNRTAVQLSLEDFQAILDQLENVEDIAVFEERRNEETVPWEAVKAKLLNRERV